MNFKWILGFGILLILTACNKTPESVASHQEEQFNTQLEIYDEVQDLGSYELGDLLYLLMPQKQQMVDWNHLANEEIKWQYEAFNEHYDAQNKVTSYSREGILRVNILGERASFLKERHYELPWTLRYKGGGA